MIHRLTILLLVAVTLSGCAMNDAQVRDHNRESLQRLSPGMEKSDVIRLMYIKKRHSMTNPYRTEFYRKGENTFEILFYYTDLKQSDGAITDDELTPIILLDGRVDGWGWLYWKDLVKKYEIRTR